MPIPFRLAPLRQARYALNVGRLAQLPPDNGYEVAFAGRSNAGKSSTVNAITDQKQLARTSGQPGRTQQLVFFDIDESHRLVDLPGYGYAKAPLAERLKWAGLVERYLQKRESLRGLVLVMDIRHPFTEFDLQLVAWARELELAVHVLLNKADKLSRSEGMQILNRLRENHAQAGLSLQLFSAAKKTGLDEVHRKLGEWLNLSNESWLNRDKSSEQG